MQPWMFQNFDLGWAPPDATRSVVNVWTGIRIELLSVVRQSMWSHPPAHFGVDAAAVHWFSREQASCFMKLAGEPDVSCAVAACVRIVVLSPRDGLGPPPPAAELTGAAVGVPGFRLRLGATGCHTECCERVQGNAVKISELCSAIHVEPSPSTCWG